MSKGSMHVVTVMVLAAMVSGCALVGGASYGRLSPADKALYNGTQSGYHRLSPYFAASVDGGILGGRLMEIYHYPYGVTPKVLIGTVSAVLYEWANYGPPEQHFRMSSDGRSLLYFHEKSQAYGKLRKPSGLYVFREGSGDALVRADGLRVITEEERARFLGTDN